MLKGIISFTTNPTIASNAIYQGYKIVCMKDSVNPNEYLGADVIPASILLPSYNAISAYIDGEDQLAHQIYYEQLCMTEADQYIAAVMAASIKGINVLFFTDEDLINMGFAPVFIQFLANVYGVMCQTETTPFVADPAYIPFVLCKLFLYDFMDIETFFAGYPAGIPLDPMVIPKLVSIFNPFTTVRPVEEYVMYFNNFKERVKELGRPPIIPFKVGGLNG